MGKKRSVGLGICFLFVLIGLSGTVKAQCTSADVMENGYKFLTSSRGCGPFTVQMQTEYLASGPGTVYYVDWGDGSPEEQYVQTTSDGVVLQHTYPNSPIDCGYDVIIDASNGCNPRGSVDPIMTQVVVWTNDVINIDPLIHRVCQGYAEELNFMDASDWNCFPRDTRENNDPRWIQWVYGTGDPANRIPGITVDGVSGAYPIVDPDPNNNPLYPVYAPGELSLPIQIPATSPADVGKEFEVTLRNWNQCNPYDNDITDGNPKNPVSGDFASGDNDPMTTTARIIIVEAPEPDFITRVGGSSGTAQTTFCIDEQIYFQNTTPAIAGGDLAYSWEFYDNASGAGSPIFTSADINPVFAFENPGDKLIRMRARDNNAVGSCETLIEKTILITPLLQAAIGVTDINDNPITPEFCQLEDESLFFTVRFNDESYGTVTPDIRYRWEFYDENDNLFRSEPAAGYSSSALGPFDIDYSRAGEYRVRFIIKDNITDCTSEAETFVKIDINPSADFSVSSGCEGDSVAFTDLSAGSGGQNITLWEYDFFNDGSIDTSFTSSQDFNYLFDSNTDLEVKLKVYSDLGCADSIIRTVPINPLPQSGFTADHVSGCSELEVNFENLHWNQSVPVDYYQWEINSGEGFVIDSIQAPDDPGLDGTFNRIFVNNGSENKIYKVRLLTVAENGCSAYSDTTRITVTPGATSGFIFTNYSPFASNCSPTDIHFQVDNETQELNPTSYDWEVLIDDSLVHSENTGVQPEFNYSFINTTNTVLNYDIRLSTTLPSSCTSDSVVSVRISPVPNSEFLIDTLSLDCEQVRLRFSSVQKGLSSYSWRLEAGGSPVFNYTGTQDFFEYMFDRTNTDNSYTVRLTTKNLTNCTSTETAENFTVTATNPFVASFTVSPSNLILPNGTVTINDQSTPGDWDYLWNFGNGDTSTDPDLGSYTFTETGDYTISLTISDGLCERTYVQYISVTSPPPTVDFNYNPDLGCMPLTVNFSNLSTNAASYQWEFGDGGTSTEENPVYTYVNPGVYSVRLTAVGQNGEEVSEFKTQIITVVDKPFAYFEVRPNLVYIPDNPLHLRNLSEGALSYYWDFGDGTVSNEFQPQHTYTEPGVYTITLRAYNEHCYDSLTLEGVVEAKYSGRVLLPNAFSPNRAGPGHSGSGENDVFLPLVAEVADFRLQIFNRWGELIFEGHNQGWDGYFEGQLCPQDVYVYKLEVEFTNGDKTTKVGDVNLIR